MLLRLKTDAIIAFPLEMLNSHVYSHRLFGILEREISFALACSAFSVMPNNILNLVEEPPILEAVFLRSVMLHGWSGCCCDPIMLVRKFLI